MKKYVPFIVGYAIYASIVLITIADESGHHFWEPFLGWLVTAPLIIGCIAYFIWRHYKKHYCWDEDDEFSFPNENLIFIESWSMVDFAKQYGPELRVGNCIDKGTGEEYKACVFIQKDGTKTYVKFSRQLGTLTAFGLSKRKDELKVGITEDNEFYLYKDDAIVWENIDLEI